MAYVDERVAMLEREKRRQLKAEAAESNITTEDIPKMTLPEVLQAVREGEVVFPSGEKYNFEIRPCFQEGIPLILIKDFYTGIKEDKDGVIYVNHDTEASQILTFADKPMGKEGIGRWKKQLVTGMRLSNTYADVTKEVVLENLDYLCYRTPTGKGWTSNIIFRIRSGSGKVVGNYNCFERDKDTCGLLMEALVLRLNELLSDIPAM